MNHGSLRLIHFGTYKFSSLQQGLKTNIVSEDDQEIPQPQTADKSMAPRGRATQQPRDTRKANQAKQRAPPPSPSR